MWLTNGLSIGHYFILLLQNQKEHLKTQQENARLQKEHGGEFDVVREKNLREKLAQATVKINELKEDLTKQVC